MSTKWPQEELTNDKQASEVKHRPASDSGDFELRGIQITF